MEKMGYISSPGEIAKDEVLSVGKVHKLLMTGVKEVKFSYAHIFQHVCFILTTILTVNCAHASWQCTDLTQNFCLVDKSSKYKQFCKTSNNHTYEGYKNCNGQRDGKGTYRWPSGQVYEGNWRQGDEHGKGTKIYDSGAKYVGGWSLGKRHGQGTLIFADGGKYVGGWRLGKRHGYAKFYYSGDFKGDYSEVEYSNGTKIGTETYYFSSGEIHRYQIENGNRGRETVIKSSADIRKEKAEKRQREEKLAQQRQKEREAAEKQRKLREAKAKQEKLEVDNCLLKLYADDGSWPENSAKQLCRIAIKQSHNAIMANCILDKGYKKPTSVFDSVQNVCEQISINPGWLDKLKYSTPFGEYLTKLK